MEMIAFCIYHYTMLNSTFAAEINKMSSGDINERGQSYSYFRISLDIGMGILYLVLAGGVIYTKHFATLELSKGLMYAMSGMLALYGTFRIYRGIAEIRQRRNN